MTCSHLVLCDLFSLAVPTGSARSVYIPSFLRHLSLSPRATFLACLEPAGADQGSLLETAEAAFFASFLPHLPQAQPSCRKDSRKHPSRADRGHPPPQTATLAKLAGKPQREHVKQPSVGYTGSFHNLYQPGKRADRPPNSEAPQFGKGLPREAAERGRA